VNGIVPAFNLAEDTMKTTMMTTTTKTSETAHATVATDERATAAHVLAHEPTILMMITVGTIEGM
jgi:hypothetical protein